MPVVACWWGSLALLAPVELVTVAGSVIGHLAADGAPFGLVAEQEATIGGGHGDRLQIGVRGGRVWDERD